ncbi:MAG: ferric reductase [Epsilonproteobacteria bacterium]|nr:ferric reductase [Campylobacterota bacterium]
MKKIILTLVFLSPLFYMVYGLQSAIDPIKYIYIHTGTTTIILLIMTLCISPLKKIKNLMKYRRFVGLFTFFYGFLHFLNFFVLDAELSTAFVLKQTLDKPFIYLGMASFFILFLMSITSAKKLFKKLNSWHKFVYLALIMVTIHASMAQKVLSKTEYFYILIALILIGYRLYYMGKEKLRIQRLEKNIRIKYSLSYR